VSATNAQIARIEALLEDEPTGSLRRSHLLTELSRLRGIRFDELADQSDVIKAVVKFAKALQRETPARLMRELALGDVAAFDAQGRMLERERVGAELLRLLEDAGVDVHGT
jgi:hypothetical protein